MKAWKHQQETLKQLKRKPLFFDMSDPGTGKTKPAIDAFAHRGGRALVIAVKSNLETVWQAEFQKWQPNVPVVVAHAANRMNAFKSNWADVIVTNIDAVRWIKQQGAKFFKNLGITHLIFDESTHFKHHARQRSRAALWIRQQPSIQYVELMSGTPNPLSVTELWHQMMLLDLGDKLGNQFYRFRSLVCDSESIYVANGRKIQKWTDKPHAEEAVFAQLQPISIRHRFEDCVDIPKNVLRYLDVPLTPKLRAEYDLLENTALLEHASDPIVGTNAAVLYGKLLQLCSGAVYTLAVGSLGYADDIKAAQNHRYRVFDKTRYELVADLIAERPHASISFFLWQHQKECLKEALDALGIVYAVLDGTVTKRGERKRIIDEFQAGNIQHLIIHPKTGAHGLTLTAGRTAIWCSPVPSPELFHQGIHRIYRGGQKHKTETICIRAPRTIEEVVYKSMEYRKQKMTNFLDLIAMGYE